MLKMYQNRKVKNQNQAIQYLIWLIIWIVTCVVNLLGECQAFNFLGDSDILFFLGDFDKYF